MPTLRRPTVTLHYDDLGSREAPAVLLMHSLLCDRTMFAHLAATLANTHRVLSLDLRGHGRSMPAARGYTLDEQCDDIPSVLDHAGVSRAALVGLSMGGMLAMRAAVFHATRISSLCLLNTSAEAESPVQRARYMAMAGAFLAVGLVPTIEARVLPLMFSDAYLARSPDAAEAFHAPLRRLARDGLFQSIQAVAMRSDFSHELGAIKVPTVVFVGDEDRATPPACGEHLAARIDGATVEVLRGCGHLSTIEQPEVTTLAVQSFLARIAAS